VYRAVPTIFLFFFSKVVLYTTTYKLKIRLVLADKCITTYLLNGAARLENITGSQLVKNFPHFTETEGSLPHSQMPAAKYRYLSNCRKIKIN
jgi:hypothetical protein